MILTSAGSVVASESYWWLKVLDFPRLQLLITAVVILPLLPFLNEEWSIWKRVLGLGLLISVGIQVYYIYPYTGMVKTTVKSVSPDERSGQRSFDLVTANIKIKNRKAGKFLELIQETDPDMVLVIEADGWWEKALQPLDKRYSYGMEYPLDNGYGMLLYSKFPLTNEHIEFLNFKKVPSFHTDVELPGGARFQFHGVHPVPPLPQSRGKAGGKEKALRKVGDKVQAASIPAVVAGDLNDVAWARRERLFNQDGLLNDVRIGRSIINTYDAQSRFMRWPLDYVFVTEDFGVVQLRRLRNVGSDHFPLYIELSLDRKQVREQ